MSNDQYERRRQKRLQSLGTNNPHCVCGENRWQCLELHHVEGQAFGETLLIVCRNCHRVLSDQQLDHPKQQPGRDPDFVRMARLLCGFADLLELVVAKMRDIARTLTSAAQPVEV